MNMRVVHINTNTDWGGGEYQVLNLLKRLPEEGVETVLFAIPGGQLAGMASDAGIDVRHLPGGAVGRITFLARKSVLGMIRGHEIDLIHAHDSRALDIGTGVKAASGIPLVLSRRIASPVRANFLSRAKYTAAKIDAVLAISRTVKDVFTRTGAYPEEKVHVVVDGLDFVEVSKVKPVEGLREKYSAGRLVGGIGRLSVKKNWQFLVRTAHRMRERDIHWIIAGEGPCRGDLEALIKQLDLEDRIHLLGFRDDASSILKSLDVLFFPSIREGASVTVREAMLMGVPVVAVDAPAVVESLDGNGWLISDGDVEGAARAVAEALEDGPPRRKIVERARESAVRRFPFDKTVEGTIEVYRKILAGRNSRQS
ncbi:MAG: glycosyltransferase [Kiritimatiellia bacterium]